MRVDDSLLEKFLLEGKHASKDKMAELGKQAKDEKKPLQELVIQSNLLSEKDLTKLYADEIEVPFVELNPQEIKHDTLQLLPERIARQYGAVVFDTDKKGVKQVAMEDPDDIQALNFLHKQLGSDLKVFITPSSQLQAALDQYRDNISSELTKVITDDEDGLEETARSTKRTWRKIRRLPRPSTLSSSTASSPVPATSISSRARMTWWCATGLTACCVRPTNCRANCWAR